MGADIKNKTLYNLRLHEQLILDCGICILRVPGGWLYDFWDLNTDTAKRGVYVPYHNGFEPSNSRY